MISRALDLPVMLFLAAVQAGAPLPELAVESYPAAARLAISALHRKATARPDSVEPVGALARMLHAWELWEPAHLTYQRAQTLDSRAFEWPYLNAIVLQRLGRHDDAVRALRLAIAIQPSYLPARVKLAEALLEAGHAGESKPLFSALAADPAAEPAAQLGLGRIAAAEGRHDVALEHLGRAVSLFPEFGAAHYALARSARALGRVDEARRALALHEQFGARWPAVDDPVLDRVVSLKDDARALVQRGLKLADRGDLEGAIAAHDAALVREPSLAQAHANLISLYGRARNWAKAEEHYRAAVKLGANPGDAHYDYGVLLGLQQKWDLAAVAYRQAIAVNPLHAQAHNNLGQLLERQNQGFADAAAAYRRAVDSQPAFRLARFNLGRMLIALGRPAEAASELALLTEPKDAESPRYIFALAVAHVRAGRRDEGIKWATEARRLALEFGQTDLAAAIDRDLATLK